MSIEHLWSVGPGLVLLGIGFAILCYSFMRELRFGPRRAAPMNETISDKVFRVGNEPVLDLRWREAAFGWCSIVAPFVGAIVVLITFCVQTFGTSLALLGLLLMPTVPLIGISFAVGSWIRRESRPWIAVVGFLLNVGALIYVGHFFSHTKWG